MKDGVPHALLARVASRDALVRFVGMPLGKALAGPLPDQAGTDRTLLGCALVLPLGSVVPLLVRGTRTLTGSTPTSRPRSRPGAS